MPTGSLPIHIPPMMAMGSIILEGQSSPSGERADSIMIMIVIHPDEGIDFFKGLDAEPDGSRAVEDLDMLSVSLDHENCRYIQTVIEKLCL